MATRWTCPACGRTFGRVRQGHECAPAMSEEEYFSTGPPHERPVYEAVRPILDDLDAGSGELTVEMVSVGILCKRSRTFAELRPMQRWVALRVALPRRVESPRLARKVLSHGGLHHHWVNLRTPDDVDDDIRTWIEDAWLAAE